MLRALCFLFRESECFRCYGNSLDGSKGKDIFETGMRVHGSQNMSVKIKTLLK